MLVLVKFSLSSTGYLYIMMKKRFCRSACFLVSSSSFLVLALNMKKLQLKQRDCNANSQATIGLNPKAFITASKPIGSKHNKTEARRNIYLSIWKARSCAFDSLIMYLHMYVVFYNTTHTH